MTPTEKVAFDRMGREFRQSLPFPESVVEPIEELAASIFEDYSPARLLQQFNTAFALMREGMPETIADLSEAVEDLQDEGNPELTKAWRAWVVAVATVGALMYKRAREGGQG